MAHNNEHDNTSHNNDNVYDYIDDNKPPPDEQSSSNSQEISPSNPSPIRDIDIKDDNLHQSQVYSQNIEHSSGLLPHELHKISHKEKDNKSSSSINKKKYKSYAVIGLLIAFIFLSAPLTVTGAGMLGIINTKDLDDSSPQDKEKDKELEEIVDQPIPEPVENPAKSVALGDSTIALSNANIIDKYHGCRHEEGNWASLIGVEKNISCAGTNAEQILKVAQETGFIGNSTESVYITAGSNSFRERHSKNETLGTLTNLVSTINKKAPHASIYFIGYLPGNDVSGCTQNKYEDTIKKLNYYHLQGNEVMSEVAFATKTNFYSMDELVNNDYCNPNKTLIRLPNTTPGATWHTTLEGHKRIADFIHKYQSGIKKIVPASPIKPEDIPESRKDEQTITRVFPHNGKQHSDSEITTQNNDNQDSGKIGDNIVPNVTQ